ncbi:hypothetical protein GCM10011504_53950 [Siccirubricoccus deserti]|nr:hypothetical protein GCM10011504_53950 [Siccirubricoccus deserti]
MHNDSDQFAEGKVRQRLACSGPIGLAALRGIDLRQPDADLLPVSEKRERVAIGDADHTAFETPCDGRVRKQEHECGEQDPQGRGRLTQLI